MFIIIMSNDCYKWYTSKSLLDRIVRKRKAGETETESVTESPLNTPAIPVRKTSRGAGRPSPNPLDVYSIDYKQKCIICNNYSYKKVYTKSRISESPRAKAFLKASTCFQDLVFTRTCELQDEHSIFGADLYYHRNCMQNYLHKYESLSKEEIDNTELNVKQAVWSEAQELLEKGFKTGNGYELSVIREFMNEKLKQNGMILSNRDIKLFLLNQFGDDIDFAYSDNQRKSMMVFSVRNVNSQDLAEKIRSIDPLKVFASRIREELSAFDFQLNDRFGDAEDLRQSLKKADIPKVTLHFFSEIFNFDVTTYKEAAENILTDDYENIDDHDDKNKNEGRSKLSIRLCLKIQSLFQILYYIHHRGRRRTPIHVMNAVWAHSLGHGGTQFVHILNRLGLSNSYLATLASRLTDDRVQIPARFQLDQFTSGAIDNWDHLGEKVSEHDTVTVISG